MIYCTTSIINVALIVRTADMITNNNTSYYITTVIETKDTTRLACRGGGKNVFDMNAMKEICETIFILYSSTSCYSLYWRLSSI